MPGPSSTEASTTGLPPTQSELIPPPPSYLGMVDGSTGDPLRTHLSAYIERIHGGMVPRDDFDLFMLGSNAPDDHDVDAKTAWLDAERTEAVAFYGSQDALLAAMTQLLGQNVEPTGEKPGPNDEYVKCVRLPDSELALRLWPGSASASLICMDFVDAASGDAVNMPATFQLWMVPDRYAPWLCPIVAQLQTVERARGIPAEDIKAGEERFILKDGMMCLLRRENAQDIQFMIPVRPQPVPAGVDVIHFDFES